MRPILLALVAVLALGLVPAPESTTTIYVVRHAEKADLPGERDPELSEAGVVRAEALARTMRSIQLDACFTSQYKRTQMTLAPLAKAAGLETTVAQAGAEKALAAKILETRRGKSVVVAGHSNTVPTLLQALGVADPPQLSESDYDDLFVVRVDAEGRARLLHLHYGAPNP